MGVAASWLPPELSVVQPYSMSPVVGCPNVLNRPCPLFVSPASATIVRMDDAITVGGRFMPPNVMMIKGAFVAPARVQREAQKTGETALIMQYPAGLLEALGMAERPNVESSALAEQAEIATAILAEGSPQAFVDALHAMEDED